MLPLPEAIILMLALFAPLFSSRVWLHAQGLLLGAMLAPGAHTVSTALQVMGLAAERRFTNAHRVLNRAVWSARQGRRMLLGLLITLLTPPGATIILGADDPVERRSGQKLRAKGYYRDAVRSSYKHVILLPKRSVSWSSRPMPFLPRVYVIEMAFSRGLQMGQGKYIGQMSATSPARELDASQMRGHGAMPPQGSSDLTSSGPRSLILGSGPLGRRERRDWAQAYM